MSNKYWFRPKKYGYGFTPISWEGWLMTLIFVVALLLFAYVNNLFSSEISSGEVFKFLLNIIIISLVFSLVSKNKTKGKLKWRWGKKK